jgi:hypothetical protein
MRLIQITGGSPRNHLRIQPGNHPTHDFAKTLGAFLPLRVGGVWGADGESCQAEVRPGVRFPRKNSCMEPLNRSAAFTPLQYEKFLQHRKLKRRERRAPHAGFMERAGCLLAPCDFRLKKG